ncbi:MAG: heme ABC exporter ATP-binding protein CcmA [Anaerolineales bacterium]
MVEIRGLVKRFGLKVVLRGIDFTVNQGEFVAVLGPNGAGKSTLLRILATLARPSAGSVKIAGYDLPSQSAFVRQHLGVVTHSPLLYGDLTAAENLNFYGRMYQVPHLTNRVGEVLKLVGLYQRKHDLVRTFSRGMQQRLAIGRAILHDPAVILFDEPYSGLDQEACDMLDRLFLDVAARGSTIIMTSHDIWRVADLAARFAILSNGKIVASAKRNDLRSTHLLEFYRQALQEE